MYTQEFRVGWRPVHNRTPTHAECHNTKNRDEIALDIPHGLASREQRDANPRGMAQHPRRSTRRAKERAMYACILAELRVTVPQRIIAVIGLKMHRSSHRSAGHHRDAIS